MRFVLNEKKITTPFGGRTPFQLKHWATDYAAPIGTEIYAPTDGVIIRKWWNWKAGNCLEFSDAKGYILRFMHLSRYSYQLIGENVRGGEIIAYTGNTGMFVTGPHLHLECRDPNGKLIDPEGYFKKEVILNKDEYVERTFRFAVALWEFTHLGQHPDEKSISKDLEDVFDGKISAWDLEQKWRRGE